MGEKLKRCETDATKQLKRRIHRDDLMMKWLFNKYMLVIDCRWVLLLTVLATPLYSSPAMLHNPILAFSASGMM